MTTQFLLIVYDISNDKRRAKLHNALLNYGTPVQYSVFECHITKKNLNNLKKTIQKIIRKRKDNVRYYLLCETCAAKIEASRPEEAQKSKPAKTIIV
jgi:CRISPR-associated protein Cas2